MIHYYWGWIIEKMPDGHFNMRPETEDKWTDGANTFWQAKQDIDRWELEKKS